MGILDFYMQPSLLEVEENRRKNLKRLKKTKSENRRGLCIHKITFEKWVYNPRLPGGKKTFHYKEVCKRCGYGRLVPRTQKLFKILKDEKWHISKHK
jgi:hypothetical protein